MKGKSPAIGGQQAPGPVAPGTPLMSGVPPSAAQAPPCPPAWPTAHPRQRWCTWCLPASGAWPERGGGGRGTSTLHVTCPPASVHSRLLRPTGTRCPLLLLLPLSRQAGGGGGAPSPVSRANNPGPTQHPPTPNYAPNPAPGPTHHTCGLRSKQDPKPSPATPPSQPTPTYPPHPHLWLAVQVEPTGLQLVGILHGWWGVGVEVGVGGGV